MLDARTENDRYEKMLRKEREAILIRSWMEKTRIKCAIQDEDRKKRKLDHNMPSLFTEASRSRTIDDDMLWGSNGISNSNHGNGIHDNGNVTAAISGQRVGTLLRAKTMFSGTSGTSERAPLSLKAGLVGLPNLAEPPPAPTLRSTSSTSSSSVGNSLSIDISTTSAISSTAAAVESSSGTPRTVLAPNELYSGVGLSAFGAPVLPPALSAVTHQPQIKKSLKRSLTESTRPGPIDTRTLGNPGGVGEAFTPIYAPVTSGGGGSDSNSGAPVSASSRTVPTPRSARNGYNGNLADGSAAHCMGMAFGDGRISTADSGGLSLPGFDSQGIMGRKMSFRAAVSAGSSANGISSLRGPSSAVTVPGQGFVFSVNDGASRSGLGVESSNTGFFGGDTSSLGGCGGINNSSSGFLSNDFSSSAPLLKRVRSQGNSVSLMGIAGNSGSSEANLKRQHSVASPPNALDRAGSSGNMSRQGSTGNRRSVQDSIGASGKSGKDGSKAARIN
jgi:hypothetical protein